MINKCRKNQIEEGPLNARTLIPQLFKKKKNDNIVVMGLKENEASTLSLALLTPVRSDSYLESLLGPSNVPIYVCGHKCILIVSPSNNCLGSLLDQIDTTLEGHLLKIICLIVLSSLRIIMSFHFLSGIQIIVLRHCYYICLSLIRLE